MKAVRITQSELAAATDTAMDEARASAFGSEVLAERPAGYFTTAEYAEKHGISPQSAYRQLARLVRLGRLRKQYVYLPRSGSGAPQPQAAYGAVKKK